MRNRKAVSGSEDEETAEPEIDESLLWEIGAVLGLPLSHKQRKGKVKNYENEYRRKRSKYQLWLQANSERENHFKSCEIEWFYK